MTSGQTELSAAYTSSLVGGIPYANDIGVGRPWTLGVSHGLEQLELRGTVAHNVDYPMFGVNVGWRPPQDWEWTPVLELGYSVSGDLRAPKGEAVSIYYGGQAATDGPVGPEAGVLGTPA